MRLQIAAIVGGLTALPVHAQVYRFEAETGTRAGTSVSTSGGGYSGTGYVTGFNAATDAVRVDVTVPQGMYELWVGYSAPSGQKQYGVRVGGELGTGYLNGTSGGFAADRAGLFDLAAGTTALEVRSGWGFYNVDYFELRRTTPRDPAPVAPTLSDPLATAATRQLMNYMTGIYGSKTLAGQQGAINSAYLAKSGGLAPAVSGSDFMDYSPSRLERGANPRNETERVVNWARQTGGIPTMSWHWNAPTGLIDQPGNEWWRGFYTDATTFNFKAALDDPASPEYALLLRDIDAVAGELKKFQAAGVPVLWRPLHEAQGGWFWWGAQGGAAYKQLWTLMHDRLTDDHGLHNLIWEFTSSAAEQGHEQWYPGDAYVDVVGIDVYADKTSRMSGEWLDLRDHYDGKKLIALTETGTLPDAAAMAARGLDWSYFSPWSVQDVLDNYTDAELRALLGADNVVTLNELPAMPWKLTVPEPSATLALTAAAALTLGRRRRSTSPNRTRV